MARRSAFADRIAANRSLRLRGYARTTRNLCVWNKLATIAGMGRSTLHHHFRALTAMSPLQFQKQLRLRAGLDAASAAFEVGYESASQFNREYRRFFGKPPMRDIQALRLANEASSLMAPGKDRTLKSKRSAANGTRQS
ncbi:MAG TPA: helix-turn-helix domain-containing protein [Chthoniobacterales bacterium]|nr:helix-turn-helix domain-containing protein [Chthoniobacterales bacterium]